MIALCFSLRIRCLHPPRRLITTAVSAVRCRSIHDMKNKEDSTTIAIWTAFLTLLHETVRMSTMVELFWLARSMNMNTQAHDVGTAAW